MNTDVLFLSPVFAIIGVCLARLHRKERAQMSEQAEQGSGDKPGVSRWLDYRFYQELGRAFQGAREERRQADADTRDPEQIFAEFAEKMNPIRLIAWLRGILSETKVSLEQDAESLGKAMNTANENFSKLENSQTEKVVNFILCKIVLIMLHRYVVSSKTLGNKKDLVDSGFGLVYMIITASFVSDIKSSFADEKTRDSYQEITFNVLKTFFKKNRDVQELVGIVEEITQEYQQQCETAKRSGKDVQESVILTQCILDSIGKYEEHFNLPIVNVGGMDTSFENEILFGGSKNGDKPSQPQQTPTSQASSKTKETPIDY